MDEYLSPEDIARKGEEIYLNKLKQVLEPSRNGEYVAIEVKSGNYEVAKDPVDALEAARKAYPGELFHMVRVGYLNIPTQNYQMSFYARSI